jgi:hypothetical protein
MKTIGFREREQRLQSLYWFAEFTIQSKKPSHNQSGKPWKQSKEQIWDITKSLIKQLKGKKKQYQSKKKYRKTSEPLYSCNASNRKTNKSNK